MKKIVLAAAIGAAFCGNAFAQRNCGSATYLEKQLATDPMMSEIRGIIEEQTRQFEENYVEGTEVVYTIPVVVHVVYYNATQNISDAQINSQIAVLNKDFRRTNTDAGSTPSVWTGIAADCEINFCLAQQDPTGAATTGITRTSTTVNGFTDDDAVKSNATGGKTIWDRSKYLNIWVCNLSGTLLGYAQFPGGAASTDGVVIDYQYFGTTGTATAPFNLGRTATHEVGHWLNLYHIWGDDSDGNGVCSSSTECSGSDAVADTPNQCEETTGCPTFPRTDGCTSGNGVMFMNYMDYSNDACMNMYTTGQKTRMQSQLAAGGFRASLASSPGCSAPGTVYCSSSGNSTADEWIQTVAVGSNTNNSGNNSGYGNYTGLNWTITKGVATSFTLTPGYTSTAYPEYWKIWIDLNNDKDFIDAGELVYDAGATATTARTGSFTVPTSATATATRMRVSMKYNGAQTECEVFSYGEVEDYGVTLSSGSCGNPTGHSVSSITSSGATLNWTAVSGATSYNIQYKLSTSGTWTTTTSTTNSKVLTGLSASSTYNWQVQTVCSGTSSGYSTGTNFTTSAGCTDTYEANETSGAAKTLAVNTNALAKICSPSDIDWFKFTTTSTNPKVRIDLTTLPADYDVVLYNSAITQLGISQNGGTTSEQIIYNSSTSAATYYVKVYGYMGAYHETSSYTLRCSTKSTNFREGLEPDLVMKDLVEVDNDFMEVYPNPATENLFINYFSENGGAARLRIVDIMGREVIAEDVVLAPGFNQNHAELSGLTTGMYFVRMETSQGVQTVKVQVNR